MKSILALALFAIGCHAACHSAAKIGDTYSAMCVDEETGQEFQYLDIENHLELDMAVHHSNMSNAMYESYAAGKGPTVHLAERSVTEYWNKCSDLVSGFCSNDHVIAWTASLSSFATAVTAVFAKVEQNQRTDQSPRSICTNYKNKGTICVSWAAYYVPKMSQQQIRDIANNCAQVCEQQSNSCEARVVTDNTVEYFCVSDRAKGCTSSNDIRQC